MSQKITLIRDIAFDRPHPGHLAILDDCSLPAIVRARQRDIRTFSDLDDAWRDSISTELLTKSFYKEIANWYFWAREHARFPKDAPLDTEGKPALPLIRLLIRLLFCWFLREKTNPRTGDTLVPDELFDERRVRELLRDVSPSAGTFLNEARLTALALAIYLGAARRTILPPAAPVSGALPTRLLVLDDVLIGLDLANRLPLLRVLIEDFADWQIILLTHDRVWFELAKEHTENSGRWTTKELSLVDTPDGVPPRPVIKDSPGLLDRAKAHLTATPPDLMAAAVYIRAAFEPRLCNVCEKHGIEIPFKLQIKDVKSDVLWSGILERQKKRIELQAKNPGQSFPDFISVTLIADVEAMRSTILNRLSHPGAPTLVKSEVEFALKATEALQRHQFLKA